MTTWRFLIHDAKTAIGQMALDEELARQGDPTLRLFQWPHPAISYGYHQQLPAWVQADHLAPYDIELVERPTGGGIALHGSDLSVSVAIRERESMSLRALMAMTCSVLTDTLKTLGTEVRWIEDAQRAERIEYCLTQENPYAIVIGDRKICGLAARRYHAGWLIQGSLLLRALPPVFESVMPLQVQRAYQQCAIALEEAIGQPVDDAALKTRIVARWQSAWDFVAAGDAQRQAPLLEEFIHAM